MLGHRRKRCTNIEPTLRASLVFAGNKPKDSLVSYTCVLGSSPADPAWIF